MLRKRTSVPYWMQFQKYQTFSDFSLLKETISTFEKSYVLTKAMKAILNTIKLHAKNFVGVCWLFREEIARKSGYSLPSVDRAIRAFSETGLLKVVHWMNDKRGGQSHNIYVIQDLYNLCDQAPEEANDEAVDEANDEASTPDGHSSNPCGSKAEDNSQETYKNLYSDSNSNSNKNPNTKELIDNIENHLESNVQSEKGKKEEMTDLRHEQNFEFEKEVMLKHIPKEFVSIMNPFYGNKPEVILGRWKSFCVAVKRSCADMSIIGWEEINDLWKLTINKYKRGLIKDAKNATAQSEVDNAIGGYFYKVLCDHLPFLMLRGSALDVMSA